MLNKGASGAALVLLRQRLGLFQLDLDIHLEQACATFLTGNKARGQFPLRFVKTSGGRQIARQLEDKLRWRVLARIFL